jgi:serine/threonine-protein kinase
VVCGKPALIETRDRMQRLSISRFTDFPPLNERIQGLPDSIYAICNKALEFDPEKRYQTPGAILADVQAAIKRLDNADGGIGEKKASEHAIQTINEEEAKEGQGKTLIVVESKPELQNILREKLKKRGYRVLIFGDPERALSKFTPDETPPADCVILCAPDLGKLALEAFNQFAEQEHTKQIPLVMLVDPKQQYIIRAAKTSPNHVLIAMPLKVRELRQALVKLTTQASTQS